MGQLNQRIVEWNYLYLLDTSEVDLQTHLSVMYRLDSQPHEKDLDMFIYASFRSIIDFALYQAPNDTLTFFKMVSML